MTSVSTIQDSIYDDSDTPFDPTHPLLFRPVRRDLSLNGNGVAHTNGTSPPPRPVAVTATTVSSFTTPQPQKAELRGPPPPIPARPPNLAQKVMGKFLESEFASCGTSAHYVVAGHIVGLCVISADMSNNSIPGVKLRPPRDITPEQKAEDVQKRESEIFQSIQEKRERIRREAEAESERQRIEWEQQSKPYFIITSSS
ncbi:unnamed protein product [Cylicostephanus goldi]|uniref:Uncharacterized protein n=1 Tax=Cylicostephanus goldi TaxID=71465 RepID=A0A3P6R4L9_CYLGO|nr:unnamed protein product [Cylicostephanus goldi]